MDIKILFSNFILMICFTCQVFGAEEFPQIKVVGTQITHLDPEYHTNAALTIHKENATFNGVHLYWDLKKDLPADVKTFVKVYVTDPTYQTGTLIWDVAIPLCESSDLQQFLPNVLQISKKPGDEQCIKKGTYVMKNLKLYRFDMAIPDIESIGHYYRTDYSYGTDEHIIGAVTYYSEWGYLNAD